MSATIAAQIDHEQSTYRTTTTAIFTPEHDPFTGRRYQGNHRDLFIRIVRHRDEVTITTAWNRNSAGTFNNRSSFTYSVAAMIAIIQQTADEFGWTLEVIDDLPEGVSYPQAAA